MERRLSKSAHGAPPPSLPTYDGDVETSWEAVEGPPDLGSPSQAPRSEGPSEGLLGGVSTGFGTTVLPDVEWDAARPVLRRRVETRFLPLQRLGEGGLGEVVSVQDQDIGRRVAIKRIRADVVSTNSIVRFLQEIRTVGRLEHANIIPIHDVGRDADGALYFVMRHVDGETLQAVIERLRAGDRATHQRYPTERRVQIIAAVLEALAFAHSQGVVHRDIKPANVMIGRTGEVMVLDWGVAHLMRTIEVGQRGEPEAPATAGSAGSPPPPAVLLQTQDGAVVGSPAYMSPEQARGEAIDARSDLYSVSVMMHELLCLRHYLSEAGDVTAVLAGVSALPVPIASRVASPHQPPVPMDLSWFIHQGVQKDRARRYPSAQAMLDRLARRAEGDIPIQCHVTLTKRLTFMALRFFDRHVLLVTAFALLVSLGALVSGALGLWSFLLAAGVGRGP
jgi:serine/threonine protein kinase